MIVRVSPIKYGDLKIPVGSAIVANNHFWLHGRKKFNFNENLCRELLRIRGKF